MLANYKQRVEGIIDNRAVKEEQESTGEKNRKAYNLHSRITSAMSGTGGAPVQPGESQTGKVVKENEQSEPVETTGKGLLDKAKDAVGLGQSKQDEELTAQGGAASAGNAGASGDTAADGGSRI